MLGKKLFPTFFLKNQISSYQYLISSAHMVSNEISYMHINHQIKIIK